MRVGGEGTPLQIEEEVLGFGTDETGNSQLTWGPVPVGVSDRPSRRTLKLFNGSPLGNTFLLTHTDVNIQWNIFIWEESPKLLDVTLETLMNDRLQVAIQPYTLDLSSQFTIRPQEKVRKIFIITSANTSSSTRRV